MGGERKGAGDPAMKLLLVLFAIAAPPQPVLTWVYPAGGRQGTTVNVTLSGTGVEPQSVYVSGEGIRTKVVDPKHVDVTIAPDATLGVRELRVLNAGGI